MFTKDGKISGEILWYPSAGRKVGKYIVCNKYSGFVRRHIKGWMEKKGSILKECVVKQKYTESKWIGAEWMLSTMDCVQNWDRYEGSRGRWFSQKDKMNEHSVVKLIYEGKVYTVGQEKVEKWENYGWTELINISKEKRDKKLEEQKQVMCGYGGNKCFARIVKYDFKAN